MTMLDIALSRLEGVKKNGDKYMATCPCHDDKHQSLSIKESPEGKLLLYCHAGCSFEKIVKALDLRPDTIKVTNDTPIITDTYDYTDAIGNILYQVVRYHPKAFKHRRPDGKGGWIWDMKGITPTLYHLPEIIKAIGDNQIIFIVEGEKDADNLRKYGQVATTISGGASAKWHPSLIPIFEGAKVVIIPDNDEPGRKYALYVASLLYGWCSTLKLLTFPAKDVSDYLEMVPHLIGVRDELVRRHPFLANASTGISARQYEEQQNQQAIDKLFQMIENTSEYIPTGAVTREECQSCRGLNRYLWQQLKKPRRQPKYS